MLQTIREFIEREDAATAVEYAVMLALIILFCFASIRTVGQQASLTWSRVDSSIQGVTASSS